MFPESISRSVRRLFVSIDVDILVFRAALYRRREAPALGGHSFTCLLLQLCLSPVAQRDLVVGGLVDDLLGDLLRQERNGRKRSLRFARSQSSGQQSAQFAGDGSGGRRSLRRPRRSRLWVRCSIRIGVRPARGPFRAAVPVGRAPDANLKQRIGCLRVGSGNRHGDDPLGKTRGSHEIGFGATGLAFGRSSTQACHRLTSTAPPPAGQNSRI